MASSRLALSCHVEIDRLGLVAAGFHCKFAETGEDARMAIQGDGRHVDRLGYDRERLVHGCDLLTYEIHIAGLAGRIAREPLPHIAREFLRPGLVRKVLAYFFHCRPNTQYRDACLAQQNLWEVLDRHGTQVRRVTTGSGADTSRHRACAAHPVRAIHLVLFACRWSGRALLQFAKMVVIDCTKRQSWSDWFFGDKSPRPNPKCDAHSS